MNAIPYEGRGEEELDGYTDDQEFEEELPDRQRRRFFTRGSAALAALVIGAGGFYAGVRVEKGHTASSTSSGFSLPSAVAGGSSSRGGASGLGSGGFPGGGVSGGANASIGTVGSVNGDTIYVTETSGNTIEVKLYSATKITKTETIAKKSVRPGDSVVIEGVKGSHGSLTATSVSDSGASSTSSSTSPGSSGGGSAVSSLFGSGSGG